MAQVMGIKHIRDGIEPQSILGADMSVIGIVGTAPDANDTTFPEDTPILLYTNDTVARTALGATGTLPDAVAAISAQLVTAAAKIVLVRVEDDEDAFAQIGNILGDEATRTGMWAFLDAPDDLGVTPRLIIVPGYTSQTFQGITGHGSITPGSGGANGTFALAFTGGTGSGAAGTFTVAGGALTAITITNPGHYTVAPTFSFAASSGLTAAAASVTLGAFANQVCSSIPTILARLKAKFLPEGPTSSQVDWLAWKEMLPEDMNIIHPLAQDAKVLDDDNIVTKPLSPFIIALYARRDSEFDGVPGHSIANQTVNGLVGISPKIDLDITADSSPGMDYLEDNAGIVIRGETGVDGSLTDGGFIFWGTDTLSADTQWQFANVVRLRDYIEINQIKALRTYLGRFNLTLQTVQAVVNTMESELSKMRANGDLLDYRIDFVEDLNTPEDLRLGFLTIAFRAEEPPPLRKITIRSRRYRDALTELVQNISIQLGSAVA